MTCIAGIAENGRVWIGGDSAGVSGYALRVRADEKVFRKGEFVYGFTSSFRMGDLLRYAFTAPVHVPTKLDREYLCTAYVDALRRCFADGGYKTTDNGVESGGTFLLGYRGALYMIENNFQVAQCADGYDAVGCGHEVAIGSLHSTTGDPHLRVMNALRAAEHHNIGVRAPFVVVATDISPSNQKETT